MRPFRRNNVMGLTFRTQAVSFHPNSLYLGTASSDCTARLWDVQRGACVRVFYRHDDIVSTLAFSPDGRYLATAGTFSGAESTARDADGAYT